MWITPAPESLKSCLTGKEYTLVQSAAKAEDQDDPLPEIAQRVVRLVRAKVSAGGFKLAAGQTIPDECEDAFLAIFRFNALTRFPSLKSLLDDARKDAKSDALKLLDAVANGKFAIEEPEEATEEIIGRVGPQFTARRRVLSREQQDGL